MVKERLLAHAKAFRATQPLRMILQMHAMQMVSYALKELAQTLALALANTASLQLLAQIFNVHQVTLVFLQTTPPTQPARISALKTPATLLAPVTRVLVLSLTKNVTRTTSASSIPVPTILIVSRTCALQVSVYLAINLCLATLALMETDLIATIMQQLIHFAQLTAMAPPQISVRVGKNATQ